MRDRLSRNHAVEQFPSRITGMCNDGSVSFGRSVIERYSWDSAQDGIKPFSSNRGVRWFSVNAAFEFDPSDDGHEDCVIERGYLFRDELIAIAQMNCDIGIEQVSHCSEA
jgi:hypothetical protein